MENKEYATYYGRDGKVRCEIVTISADSILIGINGLVKLLDLETVIKNKLLILDNLELQNKLELQIRQKDILPQVEYMNKKALLYFPHCYGTTAYDIYIQLCYIANFKSILADNFKKQEILFAKNATPENYDVWFLAHSNWNGTQTNTWKNCIIGDGEAIEEYFLGLDSEFESSDISKYYRLVFVNMCDGRYAFLGIFEFVKIDYMNKSRTYRRISKVYPF